MNYPTWATLADKWTILGAELISASYHGPHVGLDRARLCLVGEALFEGRPVQQPLAQLLPAPWRADALALLAETTTGQIARGEHLSVKRSVKLDQSRKAR